MSIESASNASRLEEFEIHLITDRYAAAIQRRYLWIAQRLFITWGGNVSASRRPMRRSARTSCDGSFEVGVGGTDGIRVIFSNGVAATKLP
jgi:hypothetical protein